MAIPETLSLQDVYDNILTYNFIISTTFGTFDTSEFNKCKKVNLSANQSFNNQINETLMLGYEKENPTTAHAFATKGDSIVVIVPNSVQKITIKSKRDFLENQITMNKL